MIEAIERSTEIFSKGYSDGKLGVHAHRTPRRGLRGEPQHLLGLGTFNGKQYKAQLKDFPDLDWGYMTSRRSTSR